MKLAVYAVGWKIPGAGQYVPPDPCSGGDYYATLYGRDLVTVTSAKEAGEVVLIARPGARLDGRPKLIKELKP